MEKYYSIAYLIAKLAHQNQVDKAGNPYFLHLQAVSKNCSSMEGKICGLLHDVLEDTDVTYEELAAIFPERIMEALVYLTHPKNVPYLEYVKRVKENPIALEVKLADLKNNSDPDRLALLDEATRNRLIQKYQSAYAILKD